MFVSFLEWILKLSSLSIKLYVFICSFKNILHTQYCWDLNLPDDGIFVISWDVFMSLKVFSVIWKKQKQTRNFLTYRKKECTTQKKPKKTKGKSCTKAGNQFFIFGVTFTKYMSLECVWKLIKIVEVNWLVGAPYL